MAEILKAPPPSAIRGKCEMCGGHNRTLRMLVLADYIGWTCTQCIEQVGSCIPRRFVSAGEQTEPIE